MPYRTSFFHLPSGARAVFAGRGEIGDREVWTAVVVTNPVIRVTANFIMRIQKQRKTKLFSVEAEALRWLDARTRERKEEAAKAP